MGDLHIFKIFGQSPTQANLFEKISYSAAGLTALDTIIIKHHYFAHFGAGFS
jgi:hypothetical protein